MVPKKVLAFSSFVIDFRIIIDTLLNNVLCSFYVINDNYYSRMIVYISVASFRLYVKANILM